MILIILIAVCLLWSLIEQKLLMTSKYFVSASAKEKLPAPVSFVVLSDLHNHTFGKQNQKLIQRIDQLGPDFIIVAGDIITKNKVSIPSNAYSIMEALAKRYPIYYAYGNHEQKFDQMKVLKRDDKAAIDSQNLYTTWIEYKQKLSDLGVKFLINQTVTLQVKGKTLHITGAALDKRFYERGELVTMEADYMESLIGKRKDHNYQILIVHHPLYFKEYLDWGADLTIAGHLHGGLVRLPFLGGVLSPQARFFPKYDAGCFRQEGRQMIVSRGLGTHSYMPRLFNIPELVYIRLE